MSEWLPDPDEVKWPLGKPIEGMKSACFIVCPSLKCFVSPVTDCYGCRFAFEGTCHSFMDKVKQEPEIVKEIFRPVPELNSLKLGSDKILYRGKLIELKKIKKVKSVKHKDSLFGVTGKYSLVIRFVPKFEEFTSELEGTLFFNERTKTIKDFSEIVYEGQTGDTLYALHKDDKILDILKLMETLNG
jgi:hypothetical protein